MLVGLLKIGIACDSVCWWPGLPGSVCWSVLAWSGLLVGLLSRSGLGRCCWLVCCVGLLVLSAGRSAGRSASRHMLVRSSWSLCLKSVCRSVCWSVYAGRSTGRSACAPSCCSVRWSCLLAGLAGRSAWSVRPRSDLLVGLLVGT